MKGEKELNEGMMDALKRYRDKATETVVTGIDKVYSTVDKTAEAATDKTKQMAEDAKEVKDKFKKVNLRRPLD